MGIRAIQSQPVLNFGIDFSGGSTMQLQSYALEQQIAAATTDAKKTQVQSEFIGKVRKVLKESHLEQATIQTTSSGELIIKAAQLDGEKHELIQRSLEKQIGHFDILELDFIGPTIGKELKQRAIWIVLLASIALMGYMIWRFEWSFGAATLIATLHDALFMVSFASICHIEINIEFIAAVLTIIGYSMNDTVVIFDRIRENLPFLDKGEALISIVNKSLFQTLSRTFYTGLITLMVTLSLWVFGGATIRSFSMMLFVGVIIGTYSSLCIGAPAFVILHKGKQSKDILNSKVIKK
jgi:preprotein translocase subunit SecF